VRRWLLLSIITLTFASSAMATPLDDYVAAPDPAFAYKLVAEATVTTPTFEARTYQLTSQTWLDETLVDRPLWQHWVTVFIPKERKHATAMMFINGGKNDGDTPPKPDQPLGMIAAQTNSVVIDIKQIPNQPLRFTGEQMERYKETGRTEDALITYGWDKFLRGGDPIWLARLPMTKAVVRAMDMVQKEIPEVADFFVVGGSKRGWTAWTVAAVDKRVRAVGPAVIDVLNFVPSLDNHYAAYGFWSPALSDYIDMDIVGRLHTPEMKALLAIVEPFSYVDRLTMPKYIINSAGDQFFTPDSSKFYFDQLKGEKYLRYTPNTDHGLSAEVFLNLASFYSAILNDAPRPKFSWMTAADGALEVKCETEPQQVLLWQAHNPEARDFRMASIGKAWKSTPLEKVNGVYNAQLPAPDKGYSAFFVEVQFPNPNFMSPFVFTTSVSIIPDTYPGAKP
jgi:PhoPQ-activated pathogenicity-related protein